MDLKLGLDTAPSNDASGRPLRSRTGTAPPRPLRPKDGQQLMLDYMASTESTGELPLYNPDIYKQALELGAVPGRHSTSGR